MMSTPLDSCPDVRDQLDAYLDGDLSPEATDRFETHCATCSACAEELAFARTLQHTLHALPVRPCPEQVTSEVLTRVRSEQWAHRHARLRALLPETLTPVWRPALALASVLTLVLTLSIWRTAPTLPPPEATYSTAEVDQALAEVQWTLAFLNDVGRKTGTIVREDVITDRVISPVREVLDADSPSSTN